MKVTYIMLGLLALPAVAAAQDIPAMSLAPGEAATVRFGDGGRVASRSAFRPIGVVSILSPRAISRE